jgi:HK97 family phage portal protein
MKNLLSTISRRFLSRAGGSERRATSIGGGSISDPPGWLERLLLGNRDVEDVPVEIDERNALAIPAVFACVRAISEDVAKLPIHVYRQTETGKERLRNHPLARLVRGLPNPHMSWFDLASATTAHALTWGNGYVEIVRDGNNRPSELWPLEPDRVEVRRSTVKPEEIVYVYNDPALGKRRTIFDVDVLHIKGLGYDGLVGYSVIGWARRSLALTAAAEKFGSSFFGNSSLPKGVLEHPGVLGDEAQKNLRESWEKIHRGVGNYGRVAILEEGMKFNSITIPPDDAQFLETRQFQIPEICRWFRMPPHKIADLTRATFSNIEHSSIEYVGDTLLPWFVRWEQEIRRKCFTGGEGNLFVEFVTAALLRGDLKSRYDAYAIGRQWGWLSPNDVREFENLNPIESEGGEIYLVPANMANADVFAKAKEPQAPPTPPTPPPGGDDAMPSPVPATTRAYRDLVVEAVSRLRRVEGDKISRHAKRDDSFAWMSQFVANQRAVAEAEFRPLAIAYIGSAPGRPPTFDYLSEARILAEDLGGDHAARLAKVVFSGNWTADVERRSLAWTEDVTDEVDAIIARMESIVARRIAENWQ